MRDVVKFYKTRHNDFMKLGKINVSDLLTLFFCFSFFIIGSIVSLNRFWQYDVSFIDFGQYDRAIWLVSRFQEPIVQHFIYGRINVLGDHVTPSIFLISPLYWFTNRSEIILIVQALAVALSGFFLYDLAKSVLKDKLLAFSALFCYFLFEGLQNAVITEFHELTVMTLPLMLTFWAIVKNKKYLYFVFLILTLGFKEVTFMLGIGIGIALFFIKKEWGKQAIATIIISCLWGFLAFKVIIPYFNHAGYMYANNLPPGIIPKALALVDKPEKIHTLFFSFFSFSFLPIFAPQFWAAIFQDYASRFMPANFLTRWGLGMHYNAQSAVLLAVSFVFGLKSLLRFKIIKKYSKIIAIIFILNAFVLFRFVLHGPFLLAFNSAFYKNTSGFNFLNTMVEKIPQNASVMTQNNLATRFTHQNVQLLNDDYATVKPDYILMDMREGQDPNDYYASSANIQGFINIFGEISHNKNYMAIYKTNKQVIFKRI